MERLLSFQRNHVLLPPIWTLYVKEIKAFLYVGTLKIHYTLYSTVKTVRRIKWKNSGVERSIDKCLHVSVDEKARGQNEGWRHVTNKSCHSLAVAWLLESWCTQLHSHVRLFATPWPAALQSPLSMEFSRQEYESCLHFRLQGISLSQGLSLCLLQWHWIFYHSATW